MQLLLDIARCAELAKARANSKHPCSAIVGFQKYGAKCLDWQVPEPWRGDIVSASLLFVSSNPSIDPLDDAPWSSESDDDLIRYFGLPRIGTNFPRSTARTGAKSKRPVSFWTGIHQRAIELYNRDVRPGIDYALTEVVHCKSRDEIGVADAKPRCMERYFHKVLSLSRAKVIVALGDHAKDALSSSATNYPGRLHLYLPHPNARTKRKALCVLEARELVEARSLLDSKTDA